MNNEEIKIALKHMTETCLIQLPEIIKQMNIVKEDEQLSNDSKSTFNNFANYHLMILCILLNEVKDKALEDYPEAKTILDWANDNYNYCLKKKFFKVCSCTHCQSKKETVNGTTTLEVTEPNLEVLEAQV